MKNPDEFANECAYLAEMNPAKSADDAIELWCALFDLLIAHTDLSLEDFVDMAIDAYQRKSSQ